MAKKEAHNRAKIETDELYEKLGIEEDTEFLLTDSCMWEMNMKNGTENPHAIEVVDLKTGQVRYIKSGSTIKFVEGCITATRDQESYNKLHRK